jgi:hypothetical protein
MFYDRLNAVVKILLTKAEVASSIPRSVQIFGMHVYFFYLVWVFFIYNIFVLKKTIYMERYIHVLIQ